MMRFAILPAAIFSALLALASPAIADPVQYKYREGDRLSYQIDVSEDVKAIFANVKRKLAYSLVLLVKSASEDRATLSVTFERITLFVDVGGKKQSWDSKKKDKVTAGIVEFSILIGKSVTVVVGRDGRIESVEGYGDFRDKWLAEYKKLNPLAAQMLGAKLGERADMKFNDGAWRQKMSKFFAAFPAEPLEAKGKYTEVIDQGTMKYNCEHTVGSVSKSSLKTKISGKVEAVKEGMTMVKSKVSGSLTFDPGKGVLKEKKLTVSYTQVSETVIGSMKETIRTKLKKHKKAK